MQSRQKQPAVEQQQQKQIIRYEKRRQADLVLKLRLATDEARQSSAKMPAIAKNGPQSVSNWIDNVSVSACVLFSSLILEFRSMLRKRQLR